MLNKFKQTLTKYSYIYLPILTLLCLAGFIGSYLFPNKVLDTYKVNMEEAEGDSEYVYNFTGAEDEVGYLMQTDGRVLKGFQVGISKNGAELAGTELLYRVYSVSDKEQEKQGGDSTAATEVNAIAEGSGSMISYLLTQPVDSNALSLVEEGHFDLGTCMEGQYPYLPLSSEACTGILYITLTYRANGNAEGIAPGIFMNHSEIQNAGTYVLGQRDGNVKCYYIYTHDTYPFLYDSRVMLCIFLACSACVAYPAFSKKKKEVAESDEEV